MARAELHCGDCRDVLPTLEADSFDACVTDPPYGLSFMGKGWDHGVPGVEFWQAVHRVLKSGAVLLAFGGTRTYHRLVCAIEDAGFLIEDSIHWIYGQGFPKHKSKLKPAHEPIAVARKPGPKWLGVESCRVGYGGKSLEEVHKEAGSPTHRGSAATRTKYEGGWPDGREPITFHPVGRWPTNLAFVHHPDCRSVGTKRVKGSHDTNGTRAGPNTSRTSYALGSAATTGYTGPDGTEEVTAWECVDGCPVRLLDEQAGERTSGKAGPNGHQRYSGPVSEPRIYGNGSGLHTKPGPAGLLYGDTGSASRFYPTFAWSAADDLTPFLYCPKASKADRGAGNTHPTVKPLALTRWLVKLACPAGGTALDPFLGSGTTAVACVELGLDFVGIESDPDSYAIARRRVGAADARYPLFGGA